MGRSTISMGIVNSFLYVYQRVTNSMAHLSRGTDTPTRLSYVIPCLYDLYGIADLLPTCKHGSFLT